MAPEFTILMHCSCGGVVKSKQWGTADTPPIGIAYALGGLPTDQECGSSEAGAHTLPVCFINQWAGKKLHSSPPGPHPTENVGGQGGVSTQPWPCCPQRKLASFIGQDIWLGYQTGLRVRFASDNYRGDGRVAVCPQDPTPAPSAWSPGPVSPCQDVGIV